MLRSISRIRFVDPIRRLNSMSSIHDFEAVLNNGEKISLSQYKGHPCVVVNIASKWGATEGEYKALLKLYNTYGERDEGLRILAFPCNQFGKQEPGTDAEIKAFAESKGFKGDLFKKIEVNGKGQDPLWKWMKSQKNGAGTLGNDIKWNFTKFLINQQGQVVCREGVTTSSEKLAPRIEKLFPTPF